MPNIALVTDSTATIPKELLTQYDIKVGPQISIWGEESLLDGVDITPAEFYERLETSDIMPKSSQVTVQYFVDIFNPLVSAGTPILVIAISEKLSGTLLSARQAKEMFPDAQIEIVDSGSVSMELGFQVLAAARAAEAGQSFRDVVQLAENAKNYTGLYFMVDTLEYLHRGGRIGGASKLLGTALNMKPLLHIDGGQVESLERVRTKTKAMARIVELTEQAVEGKQNIRIAAIHAAALPDAQTLLDEMGKLVSPEEMIVTELSPVVGTHGGPGTLGLAYCTDL
jgi:DegV family protein with EDD domain